MRAAQNKRSMRRFACRLQTADWEVPGPPQCTTLSTHWAMFWPPSSSTCFQMASCMPTLLVVWSKITPPPHHATVGPLQSLLCLALCAHGVSQRVFAGDRAPPGLLPACSFAVEGMSDVPVPAPFQPLGSFITQVGRWAFALIQDAP